MGILAAIRKVVALGIDGQRFKKWGRLKKNPKKDRRYQKNFKGGYLLLVVKGGKV